MNFEWKSEYSIGIPEIDVQHKQFLKIIESLYNESEKQREQHLFDELFNYSIFHFVSEEKLMDIYRFPCIEEQKESHREIQLNLTKLINPIPHENNNKNEIVKFLINWFIQHTTYDDKKLGKYILSKRIV